MKKTISAVKYGLETLGVTPDKLFGMIESSQDYTGDDYGRWLASQIINIAEADGVGFSQLIVKKFNILSDLSEMDNLEVREEYLDAFKDMLGGNVYTYGVVNDEESPLDDLDWYHNMDYDTENCFFLDEIGNDALRESIKGGRFDFLLKLSMSNKLKKSDLLIDAKNRGLSIKTEGGAILHRVCLLYDVFGNSETKFGFLVPSEFMSSEDNWEVVSELVDRFNISGYYMSDLNPYYGEYVFCICKSRGGADRNKFISLVKCEYGANGFVKYPEKARIFSKSSIRMVDYLKEKAKGYNDKVLVVKNSKPVGYGVGYAKALGYLCVNSNVHLSSAVCAMPEDPNIVCIPITESNIKDIIAFYGAYKSNEGNGYFSDINVLMSGSPKYNDLVYNSLPIFLFDYDSGFKGYSFVDREGNKAEIRNCFDLKNSELVKELLADGESYYTFESKELLGVCKKYLDGVDDTELKSFEEIRVLRGDESLDNKYRVALKRLKEYISTTFRGLLKC